MIFVGPLINAGVVLLAGIIGSFLRRGIPEKMATTVTQGVGICVLIIGIRGAIKSVMTSAAVNSYIEVIAVICMALGIVIGELIDIDKWMNRLGDFLQSKMNGKGGNSRVGEGFVSATMIFCIGAWAITGAMESAANSHTSLIAKAVVDGITALVLASSLGWGVSLSSIALLIYQGGLTLLFYAVGAIIAPAAMEAMGIVGSLVIMMIAFNLMGITRIRAANCIPAVFLPILAVLILA